MKIAAVYSVFNEEEYLEYSVRSIRNHVDGILINVTRQPWQRGNAPAPSSYRHDRTEEIVKALAKEDSNITYQVGAWPTEVAQRQAGMEYCLAGDSDYYFLVDGDEGYRPDHLRALRDEIEAHPEVGTFQIKCAIFWRSFGYRIPAEAMKWTPWRVFKISRHRSFLGLPLPYTTRFIGDNRTNSLGCCHLIPPQRCFFYHFSYARSEEKMHQKITTFSVADQVMRGWYERVWLPWPSQRQMRNIHPMVPEEFPEAFRIEPTDLPEVMRTHPYASLDVIR